MTTPRTLAALLVMSALATPALAQAPGGSDNGPPSANISPPVSGQPGTSNAPPAANSPAPSVPEPASLPPALLHNPTADVQARLQQLGLYSGEIDGKWGPQTRGAVVDFQRSHELRPTGTLDVATVARLRQITQAPTPAEANNAGQEPSPGTGAAGNTASGGNTAEAAPPAQRRPGASTAPGAATSPGRSTTARATVTVPGLAVPGLGYGNNTYDATPVPGPGVGVGAGGGVGTGFFGSPLDLSNGYNAAVGRNGR